MGNHLTKFEICLIYCWFYKNPRSKQIFDRFVLWLAHSYQLQYKPMENLLTSRIFVKSAVYRMDLKLCMVITWINSASIVQKNYCYSNMPRRIHFFSLNYTNGLYLWCKVLQMIIYPLLPLWEFYPKVNVFVVQIADLVWVVVPLQDVASIDKLNQPNTLPNGLLISTKSKNNTVIFANLDDREQTYNTIVSFLGCIPTPKK